MAELAVVLDAFPRRTVGWAMGASLTARLVLDAMSMAIGQRKPPDVIHHSDPGPQDTSVAFALRCKEAGIRPSMGPPGDADDNAMGESVFATLEYELLQRRRFRTKAGTPMAIVAFIHSGSNPGRRHSALGYVHPIDCEKSTLETRTYSRRYPSTKPGGNSKFNSKILASPFSSCARRPSTSASRRDALPW